MYKLNIVETDSFFWQSGALIRPWLSEHMLNQTKGLCDFQAYATRTEQSHAFWAWGVGDTYLAVHFIIQT